MPKSFIEIEISADQDLSDQLVAILSQVGVEGFWQDGDLLRGYVQAGRWSDEMRDETERLVKTIQRSSISSTPTIRFTQLEDKNWNEEWEKTITPIRVSERIVITPTWHDYQKSAGEIVLTIDPKMSFGTGYHETTRLVLQLMEKHLKPGTTLLDIGTGTGVLAIAAVTLGASSAIGVDNDEWSYENAVENLQLNHVEKQVRIVLGELSDVKETGFDVIAANIQRNVIEPLLPDMKSCLKPDGIALLSGLLNVDEEPMVNAVRDSGFQVRETLRENEWVAFCVQA